MADSCRGIRFPLQLGIASDIYHLVLSLMRWAAAENLRNGIKVGEGNCPRFALISAVTNDKLAMPSESDGRRATPAGFLDVAAKKHRLTRERKHLPDSRMNPFIAAKATSNLTRLRRTVDFKFDGNEMDLSDQLDPAVEEADFWDELHVSPPSITRIGRLSLPLRI
ncbi:hypothetical protein HY493_00050 [Candidatus Woesearchaeota archaeon]|nr:hypothetical protein [Candidatus Woesearchaeota archaeon]